MDQSTETARDRMTRRALLRSCAGVGIVAIAGCLGGDDETEAGTDDASDDSTTGNGGGDSEGTDTSGDGGEESESIRLEPEDGWAEPHDGVEVPSEPGEAILHVGGETMTLTGLANGGELSEDDMSLTGAETFELQGSFQGGSYHGDGIGVEVTRVVGYEDTSRRWVESDSIALTRGDGIRLGNVLYRLYEDGRLADADTAGELEGRRFTDEPFVHISKEGVLTVVEEINSHVDESLNGRLEFGARLPDDWTEL